MVSSSLSFSRSFFLLCTFVIGLGNVGVLSALSPSASNVTMFNHGGLKPSNKTSTHRVTVPLPVNNPGPNVSLVPTPHFLLYSDRATVEITGPPPASDIKEWDIFALAFLLTTGPFDKALEWVQLSSDERKAIKRDYKKAGIKLIVSVFGATDAPTTNGSDPIATANQMAGFVKEFDLDGIDVDYEDFDAFNAGDGSAEQWIISFTKQLRKNLPQGKYLLTHAPVAPLWSPGEFDGGGYLAVHKEVGHLIDWYNVLFYNQGTIEYTDCKGLLFESPGRWPFSALFQIAASGVELNKLAIAKEGKPRDGFTGFMPPETLADCLEQAVENGWNAGVTAWQYPDADEKWLETVRSKAFPAN